jgi:hypothetical protein
MQIYISRGPPWSANHIKMGGGGGGGVIGGEHQITNTFPRVILLGE